MSCSQRLPKPWGSPCGASRESHSSCKQRDTPSSSQRAASRLKLVRRQGGEPGIVDRAAHREVIQALPGIVVDSEQSAHFVIEEKADPSGAHAGALGFQIEDLPEHAALPEEMAVAPRFMHCGFELRKHPQRKTGVCADVLMAAYQLGCVAQIIGQQ